MNISKSWLFIVLFAFSINVIGEFSPNLHQDILELTQEHKIDSSKHDILCDTCHCSHIKSMLDDIQPEISYICNTKPKFALQKSIPSQNKTQLLKPPIS